MRVAVLCVLVTLAGCGTDGLFRIQSASCGDSFTDWYPDLTYHILNESKSGSGQFSYDPDGPALSKVKGEYSLTSGEFSWAEKYDDAHYLVQKSVSGYGYANANGDLDIIGAEAYSDIAGQTWEIAFRTLREGCSVEHRRAFKSDGETFERVEQGRFEGGEYRYIRTTDYGSYEQAESGSMTPDLVLTNRTEIATSGFSYEATEVSDLMQATSLESFYQESSSDGETVAYDGTTERFLDGGRAVRYEVRAPGETTGVWDYNVDYFGTGSGSYTAGSLSCKIEFDRGDCTYDCGDGATGEC